MLWHANFTRLHPSNSICHLHHALDQGFCYPIGPACLLQPARLHPLLAIPAEHGYAAWICVMRRPVRGEESTYSTMQKQGVAFWPWSSSGQLAGGPSYTTLMEAPSSEVVISAQKRPRQLPGHDRLLGKVPSRGPRPGNGCERHSLDAVQDVQVNSTRITVLYIICIYIYR